MRSPWGIRLALANESMAHKLAIINRGTRVPATDVSVAKFQKLLTSIREKSRYSDNRIGDMTVAAHERLRKFYGKQVPLLTFMNEATRTYLIDSGMRYEEVLAAIVLTAGNDR